LVILEICFLFNSVEIQRNINNSIIPPNSVIRLFPIFQNSIIVKIFSKTRKQLLKTVILLIISQNPDFISQKSLFCLAELKIARNFALSIKTHNHDDEFRQISLRRAIGRYEKWLEEGKWLGMEHN